MVFSLLIIFIAISLLEIPELINKKYRYELGVFLFFLGIAIIIGLLMAFDIYIPNPVGWVKHLIREILHLSYK